MSDLLNTAADTLTAAAAGTHVDISFTPPAGIRNNWAPEPVQVSGTLDSVRVYGHGSVRIVVDGKAHHLPGSAPVRVAPHLRVPDTAVAAQPSPEAGDEGQAAADEVRAAIVGRRVGVTALAGEHLGCTVEFDFRGARFYGELTAVKSVLGMYSVTLDGAERFLFDDDQTVIVRQPAAGVTPAAAPTVRRPAAPSTVEPAAAGTGTSVTPVAVAPVRIIPQPAAELSPSPVHAPAPAAWVPVPADELEFV
jgi:hypothetical protein